MIYETIDTKFNELALNIKEYFTYDTNKTLFKKRNEIKVITYQSDQYAVKSFKVPHLLNQIVYNFFRESKAKRSYKNSLKLLDLDVNTPSPIAYIEFREKLFFKESYYISDFFDYDFEIRAVFKDKAFEDREKILTLFTEFTFNLHEKGVYHIDYSPGNILVKKVDNNYIFYIIDVNRMQFKDFNIDLRMKSMAKLTKNKEDNNFIIKYYAEISGIDSLILSEKFDFYLNEQQRYLTNKKRLKKIKG